MLKDVPDRGNSPTPLILDLLEWLNVEPRPYAEVMDSWKTSCPRLTVWEDVVDGGFVVRRPNEEGQAIVKVTPDGRRFLMAAGRL